MNYRSKQSCRVEALLRRDIAEYSAFTIRVIANAIRMYRMVATEREPRMAMGKSRLGFLA